MREIQVGVSGKGSIEALISPLRPLGNTSARGHLFLSSDNSSPRPPQREAVQNLQPGKE